MSLLIEQDIIDSIESINRDECSELFNHFLMELVRYFRNTLKNEYNVNDPDIGDILDKLDMYESFFPTLINVNYSIALDIFVEKIYVEHGNYITDIIRSGKVEKQNVKYFTDLDFSSLDKNSLLHIFRFKSLVDKIELKVYYRIFYYLGVLVLVSRRYCKILLSNASVNY